VLQAFQVEMLAECLSDVSRGIDVSTCCGQRDLALQQEHDMLSGPRIASCLQYEALDEVPVAQVVEFACEDLPNAQGVW
jgi:hypothetical protein